MIVKRNLLSQLMQAFSTVAKALRPRSEPYVPGPKIKLHGKELNATPDPYAVTDREQHRAAMAKKGAGANVPFDII